VVEEKPKKGSGETMHDKWRILDFQGLEYIVSTEELRRHNPEWVLKIALLFENRTP